MKSERKKIKNPGYPKAVTQDNMELCSEEWKKAINEDPTLYCSAKEGHTADLTEVHAAIGSGRLFSADYILLQNGRFKPGAAPCLSGAYVSDESAQSSLAAIARSAGSNFYLAQIICRFFFEKRNDDDTYFDLVKGRKNYLDTIYWLQGNKKVYYHADNQTPTHLQAAIENSTRYWQLATELVDKQRRITGICPPAMATQYQTDIGNIYLDIAMQEERSAMAFHWLLKKANESFLLAKNEKRLTLLANYVDLNTGSDEEILQRTTEKFKKF